jgi:hypothetical protein
MAAWLYHALAWYPVKMAIATVAARIANSCSRILDFMRLKILFTRPPLFLQLVKDRIILARGAVFVKFFYVSRGFSHHFSSFPVSPFSMRPALGTCTSTRATTRVAARVAAWAI